MGARLEHVIARNVAELRTQQGATQSDLAEKMQANGFTWTANRVAQIETLRRPVSLLEVVGLARVFLVSVSRLLVGDEEIALPLGDTMPLEVVRAALVGEPAVEIRHVTAKETRANQYEDEYLRKLMRRFGLERPNDLQALAYRVFGQSFRAERETRLGDVSGMSKRSAQTKRGHVTRALLTEILEYLGEGQQRVDRLNELHNTTGSAE